VITHSANNTIFKHLHTKILTFHTIALLHMMVTSHHRQNLPKWMEAVVEEEEMNRSVRETICHIGRFVKSWPYVFESMLKAFLNKKYWRFEWGIVGMRIWQKKDVIHSTALNKNINNKDLIEERTTEIIL